MSFRKRGFRAMTAGLLIVASLVLAPAAFARGHFSVGVSIPGVTIGYGDGYWGPRGYVNVYGPAYYDYGPAYYDYGPAYYDPYYYAPAYPVYYGSYYYGGGYRHHYRDRDDYRGYYRHDGYRHAGYRYGGHRNDGYRHDGYRHGGYRDGGHRGGRDGYRGGGHRGGRDGHRHH